MAVRLLSACALLLFGLAYFGKLLALRLRDSIQANTFGKRGKSPALRRVELASLYSLVAFVALWALNTVSLSPLRVFSPLPWLNLPGALLCVSGAVLFTAAAVVMDRSWRVGVDVHADTQLVTRGVYRLTRNPAFVGIRFLCLGAALAFTEALLCAAALLAAYCLHRLILQEEAWLETRFGAEYLQYKAKTPRYLFRFPSSK